MSEGLGEYLDHSTGKITIGYEKGSTLNARADGNIRGTYGKKSPIRDKFGRAKYKRDFLGIHKDDLNEILSRYPIEDDETRTESVRTIGATRRAARERIRGFWSRW